MNFRALRRNKECCINHERVVRKKKRKREQI